MNELTIGNTGHLFVILSFVTALVATFAYLKTTLATYPADENHWKRLARGAFYIHGVAVVGVVACLFSIIYNHRFEYQYAWSHSSLALPVQYMISCFWEGQEGSFLLWLFWNAVLGIILTRTAGSTWEGPMLTVFALVQAFLASMILGVVFGDVKIGSSPFLLLKDSMPDAPVFTMNPNFIPQDGKGLNPLLQNYWMVIHPPTLFLGFALTLVPFAYCIAGLWRNQPLAWIRPAQPWMLVGGVILGVGIIMGGYWAYETLNFGGYWNWDPVENAVYVPWLVMVAAMHTMLTAKRSSAGLKMAIILTVAQFLLILYSTFLTRSGILGNASVHSFTDLGLSGQLLVYLLVFVVMAVALMAVKWKLIPSDEQELSIYNKELWLFLGAIVLCLAGFQVLSTTSIPVYSKVAELFGKASNLAMPTNQIAHYNKFQIWFFSLIAVLTGVGQYIWWRKAGKDNLNTLMTPLVLTLLVSAAIIGFGGVKNPIYMVFLTTAVFAIMANGAILLGVLQGNYRLSGGAVAHMGMALMLIGILFSSGYSKVTSINNSGLLISKSEEFTKDDNKENKENVLLWLNQSEQMGGYQLTYRGQNVEVRDMPGYVPRKAVEVIEGDFRGIAQEDLTQNGKLYHKKGDTVALYPENIYYEVEYREPDGKVFSLYPRAQVNERMGTLASPDIRHKAGRDLYTFVSSVADPNAETIWGKTENYSIAIRDTFFLNDYVAILDNVVKTTEVKGIDMKPSDVGVKAQVRVLYKGREVVMQPAFVIRDGAIASPADISDDLGVRLQLKTIDPKTGLFTFAANQTQRDYIVMKASEKPLINLLWIGTLVLVAGFLMAIFRRYRENRKMDGKAKKEAGKSVVSYQ
ncbi:cytochrome c biogenesis protein CcsA [uncultured Fibrella sp.]|uniref:cytochrome c biogenesis protein CcsA n=1 Tax=uncultured Fibrella sp. TaxID=1284596 RepID=UPI0035CAC9C9